MANLKLVLRTIGPIVCLLPLSAYSQTPPKRDAKVQALLDQSLAAYKALETLNLKVKFDYQASDPSMLPPTLTSEVQLRYAKGNKFNYTQLDPTKENTLRTTQVISDGVTIWRWIPTQKIYGKAKFADGVPTTLNGLIPEVDLLLRGKDPFTSVPTSATQAAAKLGDLECDVLEWRVSSPGVASNGQFKIYISKADHLVRGIVFDLSGGVSPRNMKPIVIKMVAKYDLVELNTPAKPADFIFTPPVGATLETVKDGPAKP